MTAETIATIIEGGIGVGLGLFATYAIRRSHRRDQDADAPEVTPGRSSRMTPIEWLGPFITLGSLILMIGNLTIMVPRRANSPPPVWSFHETDDGVCGADFPGLPVEEVASAPDGSQSRVLRVVTQRPSVGYCLAHVTLPPVSPELSPSRLTAMYLDSLPSGYRPAIQFTEISRKEIAVAGLPGMAVEFESEKGVRMRARVFSSKNDIYMIYAVAPKSLVDGDDIGRFLGSIRLKVSPP